jgi:hypothetical protein
VWWIASQPVTKEVSTKDNQMLQLTNSVFEHLLKNSSTQFQNCIPALKEPMMVFYHKLVKLGCEELVNFMKTNKTHVDLVPKFNETFSVILNAGLSTIIDSFFLIDGQIQSQDNHEEQKLQQNQENQTGFISQTQISQTQIRICQVMFEYFFAFLSAKPYPQNFCSIFTQAGQLLNQNFVSSLLCFFLYRPLILSFIRPFIRPLILSFILLLILPFILLFFVFFEQLFSKKHMTG